MANFDFKTLIKALCHTVFFGRKLSELSDNVNNFEKKYVDLD